MTPLVNGFVQFADVLSLLYRVLPFFVVGCMLGAFLYAGRPR
jgi:hypothetical protein